MTSADLVTKTLADYASVGAEELARDALLVDIGVDSLDLIQVAMELEEVLDIELTDDSIESFKTVGDIVDLCEKL